MKPLSRVIWHEGMHLAQHTFQAQSRYFEDSIQFAVSHLFFKPYGVAGIELDGEALRNGTVSVIHARGVMPDGLAFLFPDGDPPPPPLDVKPLFSPTHDSQLVLLTVPGYRPGQANCRLEATAADGADRRFVAETGLVPDETSGLDQRPVTLGRKNFRLELDAREQPADTIALPVARVRRDGAGHFIYDPAYVPPALQIGASPFLLLQLARLVDLLDGKSETILSGHTTDRKALADYASHEVASFWLSHTLRSSLAPLRHHLQTRRAHPEQLYVELGRLAGALCTFALDSHPRSLPLYDHDHLSECFEALERHIRAHLEVIVPTGCVTVPLAPSADYLHVGAVSDSRCLGPSRWFLGVRSALGAGDVIRHVPQLVKICAQKHILRLVKEAFPGLPIAHLPQAPAGISPRPGTQYFSVGTAGPCWEAMSRSADVAIYVPDPLRDAEIELKVLLQG